MPDGKHQVTSIQPPGTESVEPSSSWTAAPKTSPWRSFGWVDESGHDWRIAVAVGKPSPTFHADNCGPTGAYDAPPGQTNVPVYVHITNELKDRSELTFTALRLEMPGREGDVVYLGPDDGSGSACDCSLSIGRWFEPGETVSITGYVHTVPEPVPATAVLRFADGARDYYMPVVHLNAMQ